MVQAESLDMICITLSHLRVSMLCCTKCRDCVMICGDVFGNTVTVKSGKCMCPLFIRLSVP